MVKLERLGSPSEVTYVCPAVPSDDQQEDPDYFLPVGPVRNLFCLSSL